MPDPKILAASLIAALSGAGLAQEETPVDDGHWPSFRGHLARGVADGYETAIEWDGTSGEGVTWRTPVPGLAHSSPVVWSDAIFVTTAVRVEGDS